MPYRWSSTDPDHLTLWPYRSLSRRGFVVFIAATAGLLALPLLTLLGAAALWVLLPFVAAALAGIWAALERNRKDREIVEELVLRREAITLTRRGPRQARQAWQANPHWVRLTLYAVAGPVPQYLTLTGNGREVELGAFLTEEERLALKAELEGRLAALR